MYYQKKHRLRTIWVELINGQRDSNIAEYTSSL